MVMNRKISETWIQCNTGQAWRYSLYRLREIVQLVGRVQAAEAMYRGIEKNQYNIIRTKCIQNIYNNVLP